MKAFKAPDRFPTKLPRLSVFLGGTIDMGSSHDWQADITRALKKEIPTLTILNPRRAKWDSSWKQTRDNPHFLEQVTWELKAQEKAGLCVYYFASGSASPITLLELGYFGPNSIVYCPYTFYRSGNIHIFCERYGIPCFTEEKEWKAAVLAALKSLRVRKGIKFKPSKPLIFQGRHTEPVLKLIPKLLNQYPGTAITVERTWTHVWLVFPLPTRRGVKQVALTWDREAYRLCTPESYGQVGYMQAAGLPSTEHALFKDIDIYRTKGFSALFGKELDRRITSKGTILTTNLIKRLRRMSLKKTFKPSNVPGSLAAAVRPLSFP